MIQTRKPEMRRIAFLALVMLAACGQSARTYPPEYHTNFTAACERQTEPGVCACAWEQIETNVPVSEFEALERLPESERASHSLTQQIQGYFLQCAGDTVREPLVAP